MHITYRLRELNSRHDKDTWLIYVLVFVSVRSVVCGTPDYSTSNTDKYDINEICSIEVLITQKWHYLQD